MHINSFNDYKHYIKSLEWSNYNDFFDNQNNYEMAFLNAIKEENYKAKQIIIDFYNKGFMIDENINQVYATLPAAIFLINSSPYYIDILLDFFIDNFRTRGKSIGRLACVNYDIFKHHYEIDNIVYILDFNRIIKYLYNREDVILIKKIFQLFSFMPNPTNLFLYEKYIKKISLEFYLFAISISFKINGLNEILNKYIEIAPYVKDNILKIITNSFVRITDSNMKDILKRNIINDWFSISPQYMYWFLRQDSIGYWSLIGYIDNWKNERDLEFIKKLVKIKCPSFQEEDEKNRIKLNKLDPKQIELYKSIIYSEQKITEIKKCLKYYQENNIL